MISLLLIWHKKNSNLHINSMRQRQKMERWRSMEKKTQGWEEPGSSQENDNKDEWSG